MVMIALNTKSAVPILQADVELMSILFFIVSIEYKFMLEVPFSKHYLLIVSMKTITSNKNITVVTTICHFLDRPIILTGHE